MKLVVFAHTPPPHHGQSYMVESMLASLGGDARQAPPSPGSPPALASGVQCYHVNCRLSQDVSDIGRARKAKLFPLLKYCLQAIRIRFAHGADHFYFVPAAPCRLGMWRDWIVLGLCRPFFRRIIYHWHAAGLGLWIQSQARPWERWISRRLLFQPDLSLVLGSYGRQDGEAVLSRRVVVVPNGLPDPIPAFDREVLPRRAARWVERARLMASSGQGTPPPSAPRIFSVLYMSHCCREKGLFDALEAVVLCNQRLAQRGSPVQMQLSVAGTFLFKEEEEEFQQRLRQPDMTLESSADPSTTSRSPRVPTVLCLGFVSGEAKHRLLRESDCLCAPTWYAAESLPTVLLDAMAFGLPIVTTRWRNIPDLFPSDYAGLVDPHSPSQVAEALLAHLQTPYDPMPRARFLACYTRERFIENLLAAFRTVKP